MGLLGDRLALGGAVVIKVYPCGNGFLSERLKVFAAGFRFLLPAFAILPDEVRALVVDSFELVSFPFGAVIVREGDEADAFYVLAGGTARVVKEGDHGEEIPLNVSPGRTGLGQTILSTPSPIHPPASCNSPSTRSFIVSAAVCHPLATKLPKTLFDAASSSK